jgi:hypothetical protein
VLYTEGITSRHEQAAMTHDDNWEVRRFDIFTSGRHEGNTRNVLRYIYNPKEKISESDDLRLKQFPPISEKVKIAQLDIGQVKDFAENSRQWPKDFNIFLDVLKMEVDAIQNFNHTKL